MKEDARENQPAKSDKKTVVDLLLSVIGLLACAIALLAGALIVSATGRTPQTPWFGVGQSLMASGLFGLIMLLQEFTNRRANRKSSEGLQGEIAGLRSAMESNAGFSGLGLVSIYSGVEKKGIRKIYAVRTGTSEKRIEILGREVDGFTEDFLHAKDGILGKTSIESIKVLLRHPGEHDCCRNIALQKACAVDEVTRHIVRNTRQLLAEGRKDKRIRVKWYQNACEPVTISVFDDTLFVTPYLAASSHKDVATLELQSRGSLFREYHDHFNYLWDRAVVPSEELCNSYDEAPVQVLPLPKA
jgi:hypothetical protein